MAYISNAKLTEILEEIVCRIENEASTPEEAASIIREFVLEKDK